MVAKIPAAGVSLDGAVVVNESSADVDTRIESNANTHMLFVDGGNNSIGINNSTPGSYDGGADDLVVGSHSVASQGITIASDVNSILYFADGTSGDEAYRGSIIYNHAADNFVIRTAGFNTRMTIDSTGAVTMPTQPAFSVTQSAAQTNIASGANITFDTEVFDQNADFASNTFTAPVTGKYQLNLQLRLGQIDSASNYVFPNLVTSNRSYQSIFDPSKSSGDLVYFTMTISVMADMDANDTADVHFYYSAGAQQVDTDAGGTSFSGALIC